MTGKELKAILDNMSEEELEMMVVFDAEYMCSEDGDELYTPSNVYVDDEDDEDELIVIESEPVE